MAKHWSFSSTLHSRARPKCSREPGTRTAAKAVIISVNSDAELPFTDLPLDLPHAGRIAQRLCRVLANRAGDSLSPGYDEAEEIAGELNELLFFVRLRNEDLDDEAESNRLRESAAILGRQLTDTIEHHRIGDDRVGQCVRNLFECLGMGREGAILSLRAGENPHSLQRPI